MFEPESTFVNYGKSKGKKRAIELVSDINEHTELFPTTLPSTRKVHSPDLSWKRTLFDRNEHFLELSNGGEAARSLIFMLSVMVGAMPFVMIFFSVAYLGMGFPGWAIFIFALLVIFTIVIATLHWKYASSPALFCALRARYRFNRTTGKVYILRPSRFGGNVIHDWNQVLAHVSWCAPREMEHEDLHDPHAREKRKRAALGNPDFRGLVLYWPPHDSEDLTRAGEDVIWVGPGGAGMDLWQYIRIFMEEGIDAVPEPNEFEWIRKGFNTMGQHLNEMILNPSRILDILLERPKRPVLLKLTFWVAGVWAPLHWLAERCCTWPTFPEEWNSDCGQRRRESGIGPEEPLRWEPR